MRYNEPFGASDPNAPYVNGNPATGQAGSIPPAAAIEYPQREIINAILQAGLTPSNGDLGQLWKALQVAAGTPYGADTGTANTLAVVPVPAVTAYTTGRPLFVRIKASNTAAATINVNGLGAKAIVRRGGGALLANDLLADAVAHLIYTADGRYELLNYAGSSGGGGGASDGENIGDGDGQVFAGLTGGDTLSFRTLKDGAGVDVTTDDNVITVALKPMGAELTFS